MDLRVRLDPILGSGQGLEAPSEGTIVKHGNQYRFPPPNNFSFWALRLKPTGSADICQYVSE